MELAQDYLSGDLDILLEVEKLNRQLQVKRAEKDEADRRTLHKHVQEKRSRQKHAQKMKAKAKRSRGLDFVIGLSM